MTSHSRAFRRQSQLNRTRYAHPLNSNVMCSLRPVLKSTLVAVLSAFFVCPFAVAADSELDYFVLRCGAPETEFLFIEHTPAIDLEEFLAVSVVNLRNFNQTAVAKEMSKLAESHPGSTIVVPVHHFSYRKISTIANSYSHLQFKPGLLEISPLKYCSNRLELINLGGRESLEKAMQKEFKEPVG